MCCVSRVFMSVASLTNLPGVVYLSKQTGLKSFPLTGLSRMSRSVNCFVSQFVLSRWQEGNYYCFIYFCCCCCCFFVCHQEQAHMPMYHPTPSQARLATQLTEEEQIRIAQRIGLIQHLPKGVYDGGQDGSEKKIREWAFCMCIFTQRKVAEQY